MNHSHLISGITTSLLILSVPAGAEERIEPITVTATRMAQTADESLASVSVISREQIERSQATSLPQLLSTERGISLSSNGAYGKTTSLNMRGTNSDHVLVLIDGVKLGSATSGTTAFQHLPLHQIERIEVVRGPRSSLYGSEAIGGVIQIFTRKGQKGEPGVQTSAMRGSNGSKEVATAMSGGTENTSIAFSAKAFDTDGIDTTTSGFPDDDGYTNDSASLNVRHNLDKTTSLSLSAMTASGISEFDNCGSFTAPSGDCEDEFRQQSVTSSVEKDINSFWSMSISAGETLDESRLFTDGDRDSKFNTQRREVSWQNDLTLGTGHVLTLGYDYRDDQITSSADFDETERDNSAVFGQWQWTGDRVDVQLSGRRDDNEAFGEEETGSIAAGYYIGNDVRIYGSYGTAFKTPTFNNLYFPDTPFFSSNPDLDPENSETLEIGIDGGNEIRWSANLYRTEVDRIIVFDSSTASVDNLDEARINGMELSAATKHGGWDIDVSATFLETETITSGPNDGNELPRRPHRTFNLGFQREFEVIDFSAHVRHEGDRYDAAANNVELDGFTLVGFRLGYDLHRDFSLEATVNNLADVDYETAAGFRNPGRTGHVRLRYDF